MTVGSEGVLLGMLGVLVAVAVPFAASTALRHNDPANRLWCGALLAGVAAGSAPLLDRADVLSADVEAAGAACATVTLGLVWSAARWYRGVAPRPSFPLLVVVAVLLSRTVLERLGSSVEPTGYLAAAGFAGLTVLELHRGPMRQNFNVSLLQLVLGTYAVAAPVALVLTRLSLVPRDVGAMLLVLTLAVGVQLWVSVRAERRGAWWSEDSGAGRVHGVHSREQFLEAAAERLHRLSLRGGHAALVLAEISGLEQLNEAFGRRGGDTALAALAATLRAHVPPWAVLGYLGAGRFAVLAPADTPDRAQEIATALERAHYATSTGGAEDVPVPVLFGVADTFGGVDDLAALLGAAEPAGRA